MSFFGGFRNFSANAYSSQFIRSVFSSVAKNYDLMNDLMSFGIHRLWKDSLVQEVLTSFNVVNHQLSKCQFSGEIYAGDPIIRILDLAGGTGDIALRILNRAKELYPEDANGFTLYNKNVRAIPEIVVLDPSDEMISIGKRKCKEHGLGDHIKWINGEAEDMPLSDRSFDIITVAFGARNFVDMEAGLRECHRTLKPGGRLLILEFSHCENEMLSALYELYSNKIIPLLGSYIANDKNAYIYLVDSIKRFPRQKELAEVLAGLGFSHVAYRNLTGGIVAIHSSFKPE